MKEKLRNSIDKSLDWIISEIDHFEIPSYNMTEVTGITDEKKAFGELALTLIILCKCETLKNDPRLHQIIAFVLRNATSERFEFNMQKDLTLFPFYITVYDSLRAAGIELDSHRKSIEKILAYGYVEHIERSGWNQIDFKYYIEKAGLPCSMPSYEELYKVSSLYYLPSIPLCRTIDAYGITHILFYLTDFGAINIENFLGKKATETKAYVEAMTNVYCHKRDWDLLGELLMSCHLLNHRDFSLHEVCWNSFLSSQCKEGDFISRHALEAFDTNKKLTSKERFKFNYHPTLVGLFACALEYEFLSVTKHENLQNAVS